MIFEVVRSKTIGMVFIALVLLNHMAWTQDRSEAKTEASATTVSMLEGKSWKDLQDLKPQFDEAVAHVRSLTVAQATEGQSHSLAELISKTHGDDLLTQAVFKGVISGDVTDTTLVLKLFDVIAASSDPPDLPGRSRVWTPRKTMLLRLGQRLWRLAKGGELPLDEMRQIVADAQKWRNRLVASNPLQR